MQGVLMPCSIASDQDSGIVFWCSFFPLPMQKPNLLVLRLVELHPLSRVTRVPVVHLVLVIVRSLAANIVGVTDSSTYRCTYDARQPSLSLNMSV